MNGVDEDVMWFLIVGRGFGDCGSSCHVWCFVFLFSKKLYVSANFFKRSLNWK